jgi:hypothetical protein
MHGPLPATRRPEFCRQRLKDWHRRFMTLPAIDAISLQSLAQTPDKHAPPAMPDNPLIVCPKAGLPWPHAQPRPRTSRQRPSPPPPHRLQGTADRHKRRLHDRVGCAQCNKGRGRSGTHKSPNRAKSVRQAGARIGLVKPGYGTPEPLTPACKNRSGKRSRSEAPPVDARRVQPVRGWFSPHRAGYANPFRSGTDVPRSVREQKRNEPTRQDLAAVSSAGRGHPAFAGYR